MDVSFIPRDIKFEDFAIDDLVDGRGRYLLDLDPSFPLSIRAFTFRCDPATPRFNWHERLEIFVAVQGQGEFQMGTEVTQFREGDVLVVENLKHHGLRKVYGRKCKAISISFLPELVCNPGSPPHAFGILVPFYAHTAGVRIVRRSDASSLQMHRVIAELLNAYFTETRNQAGCYVYCLELFYLLSSHFSYASTLYSEQVKQQSRLRRLAKLLRYIQENPSEHIPVSTGAEMAAMSASRFMRFFRVATGMTFVSYITHVHLNYAAEMLRSSEKSICEIAAAAGFSDQSYFGRVFQKRFGVAPTKFRSQGEHPLKTSEQRSARQNSPNI